MLIDKLNYAFQSIHENDDLKAKTGKNYNLCVHLCVL